MDFTLPSNDQKLLEKELEIVSKPEVLPCLCNESKPVKNNEEVHLQNALMGTFIEYSLSGNIHRIYCCNCDSEVSFNNTDEIVAEWNREKIHLIHPQEKSELVDINDMTEEKVNELVEEKSTKSYISESEPIDLDNLPEQKNAF
jgi:hypothetical protein